MRLKKEHREKIVDAMTKDQFLKEETALKAEREKHGVAVYNYFVGHHKEAMSKLPENFFVSAESFSINVSGKGGGRVSVLLPCTMRLPAFMNYCAEIPSGHILGKDLIELNDRHADIRSRRRNFNRTLLNAIDRCTTDTQLVKAFPESEPYVRRYVTQPNKTTAIAVSFAHVRELMK